VLGPDQVHALDTRAPVAGVFFGGGNLSADMVAAAERLVADHAFMLPVVPTLDGYQRQVPEVLYGINGMAASTADELSAVGLRVVEELGLVRRRRHAFLSYCRRDSAKVAQQVYQALDQRGWQVFLDTHSVSTGVPFQPFLWDRLNDADLLVLFDTPGAVTSHWVGEELARASNLGIALLQLVWPGHDRAVGTDFAHVRYLNEADFRAGKWVTYGGRRLRSSEVRSIAFTAESIRARAVAVRRARLVGELTARAAHHGLTARAQPERFIEIEGRRDNYLFVPTIGAPRSADLHDAEQYAHRGVPRLLYDPAGLLDSRRAHLGWLNSHLPVEAVPTTALGSWLETA